MSVEAYNQKLIDNQGLETFVPDPLVQPRAVEDVPGHLGQVPLTAAQAQYIRDAFRNGRDFTEAYHENVRYRGPRESVKFNLAIQTVVRLGALIQSTLAELEETAPTRLTGLYLSETELARLMHAKMQIWFAEYLALKSSNNMWFE